MCLFQQRTSAIIFYPALEIQVFHSQETAAMTCFQNIDKGSTNLVSKAGEGGGGNFQ